MCFTYIVSYTPYLNISIYLTFVNYQLPGLTNIKLPLISLTKSKITILIINKKKKKKIDKSYSRKYTTKHQFCLGKDKIGGSTY